jgi:polyphosphate:AMP phosphotransferase
LFYGTHIDREKHTINEKDYKRQMKRLQSRLAALQFVIAEYKIPLFIMFEGWSAAGKGTQIGKLLAPLDPRWFNVYSMAKTNEEANFRPFLWKYAQNMPSRGNITIYDKSWYRLAMQHDSAIRVLNERECDELFHDAAVFERQLSAGGTLIIKIFLHITRDEQKRRLDEMESHEETKWRVKANDRKQNNEYEETLERFEEMLGKSNEVNPWTIVQSNDGNFATVEIYKMIIERIETEVRRIETAERLKNTVSYMPAEKGLLARTGTRGEIEDGEYKEKLAFYQDKISMLGYMLYARRKSVVIVYEGSDAAGKGGNIKRLTNRLDPRSYEVVPIGAPTLEELNHHYLWRFWKKLPKDGHITIFDRSWYGRVLVERVEGLCAENDWKRAYDEINDFERHLSNHGTVVVKFWLSVSKEEQLMRFKERQATENKQYKITDEDWRNRERWDDYRKCVEDMIDKTSKPHAEWHVIPSDCKKYARIRTLEIVTGLMEEALLQK